MIITFSLQQLLVYLMAAAAGSALAAVMITFISIHFGYETYPWNKTAKSCVHLLAVQLVLMLLKPDWEELALTLCVTTVVYFISIVFTAELLSDWWAHLNLHRFMVNHRGCQEIVMPDGTDILAMQARIAQERNAGNKRDIRVRDQSDNTSFKSKYGKGQLEMMNF